MNAYNFYVYILTNDYNNVMYIGVTNDLRRRISEHKNGIVEGFTKRYNVHKLVYVEYYQDIRTATAREKQLKGWKRDKKNALVESKNPQWRELPVLMLDSAIYTIVVILTRASKANPSAKDLPYCWHSSTACLL